MENLDSFLKTISLEKALLVSGALSQVELVSHILDRMVKVKLFKTLENISHLCLLYWEWGTVLPSIIMVTFTAPSWQTVLSWSRTSLSLRLAQGMGNFILVFILFFLAFKASSSSCTGIWCVLFSIESVFDVQDNLMQYITSITSHWLPCQNFNKTLHSVRSSKTELSSSCVVLRWRTLLQPFTSSCQ